MEWHDKWPEWVTKTGGVKPNTPNRIKEDIYDYRLSRIGTGLVRKSGYRGKDVAINHLCNCGQQWEISPANALRGKVCKTCSIKSYSKIRPRVLKPANYWTFERCKAKALQCSARSEFRKNFRSAYNASTKNGWLDEITQHMTITQTVYTKVRCAQRASECESRKEFLDKYSGEYQAARRNGWIDDITAHMAIKPAVYWSFERCRDAALACATRSQFEANYAAAARFARKNGWYEEIVSHMIQGNIIWTEEKCKAAALKCKSKSEFKQRFPSAYSAALRYGIIESISRHMHIEHNGFHHCVYAIVNELMKSAYIGVTVQAFEERMNQHRRESNSCNSKTITVLSDTSYIKLTDYIYTSDDVSDFAEQKYIDQYELDGYNILNNAVTIGRVGSTNAKKWTYKKCRDAALACSSRTEFFKRFKGAAAAAVKNGWYEECCHHMQLKQQSMTREDRFLRCSENANLCVSRTEFQRKYKADYQYALKAGWIDEITTHMPQKKKPNGYYTKDICVDLARKCESKVEFQRDYAGAYAKAKKNGWFDECIAHMQKKYKGDWLHPNANNAVWMDADKIYELWVSENHCGHKKLGVLYGVGPYALESITVRFRQGWNPREDLGWTIWRDNQSPN